MVTTYGGKTAYIGCTGYTGEDGFEIIAPAELIEEIWNKLLAVGHAHCLQPAGLGARDTLRTEVCYPLYGHELDENTTPIEAGVGFFVALDKGEFTGRSVLAEQKANGTVKTSSDDACTPQNTVAAASSLPRTLLRSAAGAWPDAALRGDRRWARRARASSSDTLGTSPRR